jgi:hypothetical protein
MVTKTAVNASRQLSQHHAEIEEAQQLLLLNQMSS